MGYCYDGKTGRLLCDLCGKTGAKKYRCPFGYCPAIAACAECRKERAEVFSKNYHEECGCKKAHEAFQANQDRKAQLLADGFAVRCSALSMSNGNVRVLFQRQDGTVEGWEMAKDVYGLIELGHPATVEDFHQLGLLTEAPNHFGNGRQTKQVVLS